MAKQISTNDRIVVIGAGTMGEGIAQVALQAGHPVTLVDQSGEQLERARASLDKLFARFVEKGKIDDAQKAAWLDALTTAQSSDDCGDAALVIEAVVERMDVKRQIFAALEAVVADDCLLASNTSSLSVTEMAAELKHPERFLGLHFFNPAGLMPLVEVVAALQSDAQVLDEGMALMQRWRKHPVRCSDTPGFIVNRVARPFYVESFRLLEERLLAPKALDCALRDGGGFRMGPCELTDFIGQDVNYPVSVSLWESLGYPPHLQPSFVQHHLLKARYLGRKNGRGFYDYRDESAETDSTERKTVAFSQRGTHPLAARLDDSLAQIDDDTLLGVLENGVHVYESDGRRALDVSKERGEPVLLFDAYVPDVSKALAIAGCPQAERLMAGAVPAQPQDITWLMMADRPGLVLLRVVAMIINEAATVVQHGIADPQGVDDALCKGVNYPRGAFAWQQLLGEKRVLRTLEALQQYYGSAYQPAPWLKDAAEDRHE